LRAISSAGERFVHTEEVTGSIPVSPTQVTGHVPSMDVASFHVWVTNGVTKPQHRSSHGSGRQASSSG
jgi:hypothetical protein